MGQIVIDRVDGAVASGTMRSRSVRPAQRMSLQEIHLAVERHQLADPHPGRVERLEHRPIAVLLRPPRLGSPPLPVVQQPLDFLGDIERGVNLSTFGAVIRAPDRPASPSPIRKLKNDLIAAILRATVEGAYLRLPRCSRKLVRCGRSADPSVSTEDIGVPMRSRRLMPAWPSSDGPRSPSSAIFAP